MIRGKKLGKEKNIPAICNDHSGLEYKFVTGSNFIFFCEAKGP